MRGWLFLLFYLNKNLILIIFVSTQIYRTIAIIWFKKKNKEKNKN
jgi:hypothetical protein